MVNLLSKCTTHGQKNYLVRRRTISLSDLAFLLRVLYPIAVDPMEILALYVQLVFYLTTNRVGDR